MHSGPQAEPRTPEKNGNILVIEDSQDQWTLFQTVLQNVNPRIKPVRAGKPQDAFDFLENCLQSGSGFPQLIVLDLYLPKRQDGWRTLETIQNLPPPVSQIPVLMLTSSTDLEDLIDAYQQGIHSYVIKPTMVSEWTDCCKIVSDYWWKAVKGPHPDLLF